MNFYLKLKERLVNDATLINRTPLFLDDFTKITGVIS